MTAEIAIANQTAVALAADSAVTVGRQKIYNGAEKLFALSKVEPVGIMIYGNANLMTMPWETIIKEYREYLGTKSFAKVSEYKDDFISYVERKRYFSRDDQNQLIFSVASSIYRDIEKKIHTKVQEIISNIGHITTRETEKELALIVGEIHNTFSNRPLADRYSKSFEKVLRERLISVFKQISDKVFQDLPITKSIQSKLYDIVIFALTRQNISSEYSGIVITGFGKTELYPAIHTTIFDGMVSGKLKCVRQHDKSSELSSTTIATIMPFAQQEMVHTFMEGIDPDLLEEQEYYLESIFEEIPKLIDFGNARISSRSQKNILSKFTKKLREQRERINYYLKDIRQRENIDPVLNMVSVLPKEELAAMAETLVNLTAFKRKITHTLETVGGPIDVAVISKGDGLVWVKRKQYFPPELNAHFFENYFREVKR